ncbi:MAG: efflux RND transporter periplasmic adaptor subunit [Saprospirales bacterium]|nr:efflux RND transporter periplasmic adaptor subunit [Saprospirales bacterium]
MPLYKIVDLSRVWVLFDVYESDISSARVGSTVSFSVQSMPGESFTGKISFVDPVIDPMTRVAKARVEVPNPGGKLKPEMFTSGVIKAAAVGKKESLIVPKSAVLWTGERSVVYVKKTSDRGISFLMQEVRLGPSAGDGYVIEEGLDPGTEIAVNGVFSIDAAAQLAGKPSMINPQGGAAMTGHQHGGSPPAASATPTEPKKSDGKAKAAIGKLFDLYFPLKDALVKGDLVNALKQTGELKKAFEKIDMGLFTGEAHDHWMNHSAAGMEALKKWPLGDVEQARTLFQTPFGSDGGSCKSIRALAKLSSCSIVPWPTTTPGLIG